MENIVNIYFATLRRIACYRNDKDFALRATSGIRPLDRARRAAGGELPGASRPWTPAEHIYVRKGNPHGSGFPFANLLLTPGTTRCAGSVPVRYYRSPGCDPVRLYRGILRFASAPGPPAACRCEITGAYSASRRPLDP